MEQQINELTVNGIKYIRADSAHQQDPAVDGNGLRYAIVRSRDQGVMAGFVKSVDGRAVTLLCARQLWKWNSAFVLTDAAEKGVNPVECKFSCESTQETVMLEACGILYCTAAGMESLRAVEAQDHG